MRRRKAGRWRITISPSICWCILNWTVLWFVICVPPQPPAQRTSGTSETSNSSETYTHPLLLMHSYDTHKSVSYLDHLPVWWGKAGTFYFHLLNRKAVLLAFSEHFVPKVSCRDTRKKQMLSTKSVAYQSTEHIQLKVWPISVQTVCTATWVWFTVPLLIFCLLVLHPLSLLAGGLQCPFPRFWLALESF